MSHSRSAPYPTGLNPFVYGDASAHRSSPLSPKTALSEEQILKLQSFGLRQALNYCLEHSPFYRARFAEIACLKQIDPFASPAEIASFLPFTEREDLYQYSDDFLCVPEERVVDISSTSGSTGSPLFVQLTRGDLARLAYNEFLSLSTTGLQRQDRVLLAVTLDKCFIAGLAYFSGLNEIGCTAVRVGPASPELFLNKAQKLLATAVIGVPSFLLRLHDYARGSGFPLASLGIRKLILIGEPIRNADFTLNSLGRRLDETWGCPLFSSFGITEIQSSFCECNQGRGGHFHPELVYVEIIDDNGNPLAPGTSGEVVISSLGVEGMPLLRYKTGDISFLESAACQCGLMTPRLGPILGRKAQRLKFKGTTLYSQAILNVLDDIPELNDYVVILSSEYDLSDHIEIKVSPCSMLYSIPSLKEKLQGRLRVVPDISLESAAEIFRIKSSLSDRKLSKVIDRRNSRQQIICASERLPGV